MGLVRGDSILSDFCTNMKRLIYSIYRPNLDEHRSATPYKQDQFFKYKTHLENAQREWAEKCGADYRLVYSEHSNYDEVNFQKIFLLESFSKEYDEVVYIDFDIVPFSGENIFESLDFNHINALALRRNWQTAHGKHSDLSYHIKKDNFDKMNVFVKTCAKNAMLDLDDLDNSPRLINTGVVAGNRKAISKLKFQERLQECKDQLEEAIEDNLYPEEINKRWWFNNEIFFTYIVEKYEVPYIELDETWNFLLDRRHPELPPHAHLLHHVNKEFYRSFGVSLGKEEIREWLRTHRGHRKSGITMDISPYCTLECPMCRRQTYRRNGIAPGGPNAKALTLENFKKLFPYISTVDLCGQVSDPIMHPELEEILNFCYLKDIKIKLHTAATPKKLKEEDYKRLFEANPNAKWIFGIDGLPKDSHRYRVNQDGEKLFDMMRMAANKYNIYTVWQWIVFKYNENDIQQGLKIAEQHNLNLEINISSRWRGQDDPLKPTQAPFHKKRPEFWNDFFVGGTIEK